MILKAMYNGEFYPCETVVPTSPEYRKAVQTCAALMEQLSRRLSKEDYALVEELRAQNAIAQCEESGSHFKYGFSAGLPFRIVQVHGDDLVQVSHFRFIQIVFGNGDIRFADAAFGGVFPCGQPHVGFGAVGTAVYDLSGGMMGDCIVELVLHRGEKLLCDGAFHIVVGAALGIDVRDFLVKSSLAGPDVPDTLQLFLEIILAEKVLRLTQPCVIHHIAFDDELF